MTTLTPVDQRIGLVWRGSEIAVAAALDRGEVPPQCTVICLRRQVPAWWDDLKTAGRVARAVHLPVPGIADDECVRRISELVDSETVSRRPAIWFCYEGRHRTGRLAAAAIYADCRDAKAAHHEFLRFVDRSESRSLFAFHRLMALLSAAESDR